MPVHPYKYFLPTQAAQLRRLELTVRGVVEGVFAGLHKSPHKGFSIEFAEHREYVPGDEIKHLDWTVLARTNRYYVKQYEQETNLRATICLDASASMSFSSAHPSRLPDPSPLTPHPSPRADPSPLTPDPSTHPSPLTPDPFKEGGVSKFEYASVLAASLAYLLSNQQDLVGLTVFDRKVRLEIPQGNGPLHLDQIFTQLEKVAPGNSTAIADTLHALATRIPRRGLVILISDLYDDPEKLLQALQHLRHARHQLIVLQVLDRAEVDLPYNRPLTFADMEDGSRIQIDPKLIRDDYRREMQAFLDLLKLRCGQSHIDHVLALTDIPWDQQIRELLRRTSGR